MAPKNADRKKSKTVCDSSETPLPAPVTFVTTVYFWTPPYIYQRLCWTIDKTCKEDQAKFWSLLSWQYLSGENTLGSTEFLIFRRIFPLEKIYYLFLNIFFSEKSEVSKQIGNWLLLRDWRRKWHRSKAQILSFQLLPKLFKSGASVCVSWRFEFTKISKIEKSVPWYISIFQKYIREPIFSIFFNFYFAIFVNWRPLRNRIEMNLAQIESWES